MDNHRHWLMWHTVSRQPGQIFADSVDDIGQVADILAEFLDGRLQALGGRVLRNCR